MRTSTLLTSALSVYLFVSLPTFAGSVPSSSEATPSWSAPAAAKYLDSRESWWLQWSMSQRDHETACVSCHTALPYALSRGALRGALHESEPTATERSMLANVTKRVTLWSEVGPFYTDAEAGPNKTVESRGTESILNALILSAYSAEDGKLTDTTKKAFANAWSLQLKSGADAGAWEWLSFHNAPWEGDESKYMGATMAALAFGIAPDNYRDDPAIQGNLEALTKYLASHYDDQPLFNRVMILWASARLPKLLTPEQRNALEQSLFAHQAEDGGWSLASLGAWKRRDNTPEETKSDGYATGLIAFALQQSGAARSQAHVERALAWLDHNQDRQDGFWAAYSMNNKRDPATDIGKFMTDAATAYAVMALKDSL